MSGSLFEKKEGEKINIPVLELRIKKNRLFELVRVFFGQSRKKINKMSNTNVIGSNVGHFIAPNRHIVHQAQFYEPFF